MDEQKSLREVADYIKSSGIEMVNFMYPAADGRLKTLNFTVNDDDYLLSILRFGERVDGSSLFPFIEAGNSDLYVIPRLGTMFLDPFASRPTACFLCAFLDKNGRRLDCSPEYTLLKARDAFRRRTGMEFQAMGELEFYVSAPEDEALAMYPATDRPERLSRVGSVREVQRFPDGLHAPHNEGRREDQVRTFRSRQF